MENAYIGAKKRNKPKMFPVREEEEEETKWHMNSKKVLKKKKKLSERMKMKK